MYEGFYGLKADPFRLSPDHRFCYAHRSYARAKAYVQYALYRAEGFVLVTGRPGTGKTTLVNDLLATLPNKEVVAGTLVSTQLEAEDLLLMAGHAFGLEFESPQKALVLQRLIDYLNDQHRKGLRTLLIIDEAQDLAASALEELRLLTNLQYQGAPLLQIALLGQDSLREIVRTPEMEQVHQRLIAAWQLEPLTPEETIGYVRHRLEFAGWKGDPAFEPGVLEIVHWFSKGIPRRINLICSRLLLHGFVKELHSISVEDAQAVTEDLYQEELALPEQGTEGAAASPPAEGRKGRAAMTAQQPDEKIWKGIDRGLFGPETAKAPPDAVGISAKPVAKPEAAAPPPIAASRERTERKSGRPPPVAPAPERRIEPSIKVAAVPPVDIVPEREESRLEAPPEPPAAPGWWASLGVRPRLVPWILALAIVWLVLVVAFFAREVPEMPATAALEQRPSENGTAVRGVSPPNAAGDGSSAGPVAAESRARDSNATAAVPPRDAPTRQATRSEPDQRVDDAALSAPSGPARPPAPSASEVVAGAAEAVAPAPGVTIASGQVFFRVNSTTVDAPFEPVLEEIAAVLARYDDAYAEIVGYTDRFGPVDYNMALSRQRARAVANRLIQRGIDADRLVTEGQGPRNPNENVSREEERLVEITVRRRGA